MLAEFRQGKIVPRNFGPIHHLTGSKMKDSGDTMIDKAMEPFFIQKVQFDYDYIYVTEKLDGSNVGVAKIDGLLYPVMRKGYDVRGSEFLFLREFANYVATKDAMFDKLLSNDERVCGEWLVKTHTLSYNLPHEPFVAFDIINNKTTKRCNFKTIIDRCSTVGIPTPTIVHQGDAINPLDALKLLGTNGFHGCLEEPEGVVYRYERNGQYYSSAKYVRNSEINGKYMNDNRMWNTWVTL